MNNTDHCSSTKLPRKLATTQRNKPRDVDRTKPRVVDVRGQLQSTPTKPKRDQVHVQKGKGLKISSLFKCHVNHIKI